MTQPGADHLHHLLRAWGVPETAIALLETALAALFAAVGIVLWQIGAEEWVSLLLLLVLTLVFRAGSDRAWNLLNQRGQVSGRADPRPSDPDEGMAVAAGVSIADSDNEPAAASRAPSGRNSNRGADR